MTHDWTQDVKKYVASPDDAAIKGIIRHCGIALRKPPVICRGQISSSGTPP